MMNWSLDKQEALGRYRMGRKPVAMSRYQENCIFIAAAALTLAVAVLVIWIIA